MSEEKRKLGKARCRNCGEPTYVRENAHGTLSMVCQECDFQTISKKGTAAHGTLMAELGITSAPKPPAAPAAPAPEPKRTRPASAFNLADLS